MAAVAAIGDARSGGAGAEPFNGVNGFRDNRRIMGEAQVIIGPQQEDWLILDHCFGRRKHGIEHHVERIRAGAIQLLVRRHDRREFVEQGHRRCYFKLIKRRYYGEKGGKVEKPSIRRRL